MALQPERGASGGRRALPQLGLPLRWAAGLQQALHDGKPHQLGIGEPRRQRLLLHRVLLLGRLLTRRLLGSRRRLRLLAAPCRAAAATAAAGAVFSPQASQLSKRHLAQMPHLFWVLSCQPAGRQEIPGLLPLLPAAVALLVVLG